jgi:hypothetical protein
MGGPLTGCGRASKASQERNRAFRTPGPAAAATAVPAHVAAAGSGQDTDNPRKASGELIVQCDVGTRAKTDQDGFVNIARCRQPIERFGHIRLMGLDWAKIPNVFRAHRLHPISDEVRPGRAGSVNCSVSAGRGS